MRRKTLVPAKRTENPPHRSALKSGNSSSWSGKGNELSGGQVVALAVISEPVCSPGIASILLLHGVLGPCCRGCSLAAASRGCSLVVVCGLLLAVGSLVPEHGLQGTRVSGVAAPGSRSQLSSCGAQAWLLCSMWDRLRSGI